MDLFYILAGLLCGIFGGGAYAVISMTPAEFRHSRYLFCAAGAVAESIIVAWGAATDMNVAARIAIVAVASALVGVLSVEAVRWVNKREASVLPKEPIGAPAKPPVGRDPISGVPLIPVPGTIMVHGKVDNESDQNSVADLWLWNTKDSSVSNITLKVTKLGRPWPTPPKTDEEIAEFERGRPTDIAQISLPISYAKTRSKFGLSLEEGRYQVELFTPEETLTERIRVIKANGLMVAATWVYDDSGKLIARDFPGYSIGPEGNIP